MTKVKDYSFRDIVNKFVIIENKKDIKRLLKKRFFKDDTPLFGYFYIDEEDGILFKLIGYLFKEEEHVVMEENPSFNIFDYEQVENIDVDILSDKEAKVIRDYEKVLEREDNKLKEVYSDESLDGFRSFSDPYMLQARLDLDENQKEFLDVKVKAIIKGKKENIYVAELLEDSYYKDIYTSGKYVGLILINDNEDLVIKGILKKGDEEDDTTYRD